MLSLKDAALDYARRGWHVFPLSPGTKIPPGGTAGHLDASCDPIAVAAWWERSPESNIGIAVAPSSIVVLDVDVSGAKQGAASLAQIDAQLTPTLTARTGRGGIHAVYARPADVPPLRSIDVMPGIDIIGDGYIVAAPSRLASGGVYEWLTATSIVEMPPIMRTLRKARPVIESGATTAPKISEGGRNAAMFRLGAALRGQGLEGDALKAAMHFTNRDRFEPPLPDSEVDQLVGKVMRHARVDRDAAYGAIIASDFAALYPQMQQAPGSNVSTPDCATIMELLPVLEAESKLPVAHLPFPALDDKIGGLSVHSTTLLIGGTGKGKSSLAGQISVHHAQNYGPGIYYVGEMTRSLVVARIAGQMLRRSWIDIIRGRVAWSEIARALDGLPMIFVKRCDKPVHAIAAACDRAVQLGYNGIPMLIADYLQIMASTGTDMRLGVMTTVRDLQRFTEDAPVITLELSQTSRAGAKELSAGVTSSEQARGKAAETAEAENGATNELTISYASKDGAKVHPAAIALGKGRFGGGQLFGFEFNGETGLWTPTDKPPVSEDHEQRCAEIMAQVMIHNAGKCLGGTQPCGRDLTTGSFSGKNPHKVAGGKDEIARAVEDLIDMRRIAKLGSTLMMMSK